MLRSVAIVIVRPIGAASVSKPSIGACCARSGPAAGTGGVARIAGPRCNPSSWDNRCAFNIPTTELMHVDRDPIEINRHHVQLISKIETMLNSYADTCRVRLQRGTDAFGDTVDTPQLEHDLALLRNWDVNESSEAMQKLA